MLSPHCRDNLTPPEPSRHWKNHRRDPAHRQTLINADIRTASRRKTPLSAAVFINNRAARTIRLSSVPRLQRALTDEYPHRHEAQSDGVAVIKKLKQRLQRVVTIAR